MLQCKLNRKGKALRLDHTSTLNTATDQGNLYAEQGKLKEAEEMYQRALKGYRKSLGQIIYRLLIQSTT